MLEMGILAISGSWPERFARLLVSRPDKEFFFHPREIFWPVASSQLAGLLRKQEGASVPVFACSCGAL